ncbi:serine protease inhibitor dipetalogastin-like isoform X2 [Amphiura filiformis]
MATTRLPDSMATTTFKPMMLGTKKPITSKSGSTVTDKPQDDVTTVIPKADVTDEFYTFSTVIVSTELSEEGGNMTTTVGPMTDDMASTNKSLTNMTDEFDNNVTTPMVPCNMNCPLVLDYVCGTDETTYQSKCVLETEACQMKNPNITVAHNGPCIGDPVTPGEFDNDTGTPQTDTTTGISEKITTMQMIKILPVGTKVPMDLSPKAPCSTDCPLILDIVCGTDGITYQSRCVLEVKACNLDDPTLTVAYIGPCTYDEFDNVVTTAIPETDMVTGISDRITTMKMETSAADTKSRKLPTDVFPTKAPCRPNMNCPLVLDIVCGTDNHTYQSTCVLEAESCKMNDPTLTVAHLGPCIGAGADPFTFDV